MMKITMKVIGVSTLLFGVQLFGVLTNESVVKMMEAGLSEDTIVLAIERDECDFTLDVDSLVALKQGGVSERLIQSMIQAMEPAEASNAAADAAPDDMVPVASATGIPDVGEIDNRDVIPPFIQPQVGGEYYTRFTLCYERGLYRSTNYRRGAMVPINTKVKLVSFAPDEMILDMGGARIKVTNDRDYTHGSIEDFASLMLSDQPTRIEAYGEKRATEIRNGVLRLGMTRDEVIMTRGYPPKHETPSLELDRWVFWSSRFVKQTIVFYDDVLSEGRGIF